MCKHLFEFAHANTAKGHSMSRPNLPTVGRRHTASRRMAVSTVLVMVAVGFLLGGGPVTAAPTTQPTVPVMIVLDASGSMNQADAPGPRIDAAKTAVTNLIDGLPVETEVGLQVYGTGTGSTDAEKAAGCTDIETLAPVGPLDAAGLKSQVAGVVAAGYTPIGNALRAAADALPNEGPRSIVLVSDGEDTCAPPAPCDVAKELEQQGVDLTVHTVGFKVDRAAREQLSCIADSTGGTYSDAGNATELTDALATKVDYAITGYTPLGTPVTGADQPSLQAPLLSPGQYVDTFAEAGTDSTGDDGTTKYYTIPVQAGDRMYVSATIIPPGTGATDITAFGAEIDMLAPDLTSCSTFAEREFIVANRDRNEAVTAVLAREIGASGYPKACPQQGALIVKIQRIGTAYVGQELPMEIVVRREPPADGTAVPPPAAKQDGAEAPTHGSPVILVGGSSFNDAPEIASGTTYTDSIVTGENRYFRIPLQWGQRFTYLLTPTGPAQPALFPGAIAWMDVFNPVRDGVSMTRYDTGGEIWFTDDPPDPFTASTPYPVRYTNREMSDSRGYSLDGDYYLRLSANLNVEEPSTTAYLLTVVVSGDPEPGPVYLPSGSIPTSGSAASSLASSALTTVTAASTTAASASVTSSSPASTPVVAISGTGATTGSSVTGLLWAGLGAGVVLVIGLCVWWLARRRRPDGPQPDSHR
jgi:Ca-activated chloride channel family protein